MDTGRWLSFRLRKEPLTEYSHHGRIPMTLARRLAVYALFALAAWIIVAAVLVAVWLVWRWADSGWAAAAAGVPR